MAEESKKDNIRNSTLYTLVKHIGLTPQEVAQIRLSNLHLAGKSPNITFRPPDSDESKTIALDLDAHRALVGWLVARPDSTSDYLFPGQGTAPMTGPQIEQLIAEVDQAPQTTPAPEPPVAGPVATPPAGAVPPPPRSAPELGAPPPGMTPLGAAFTPPPTAPESDEPVSMPFPSSPPPPRPPESDLPPQPAQKLEPKPVIAAAPVAARAAGAAAVAKESPKPAPPSDASTSAPVRAKKNSAKKSSTWPQVAIAATAIVLILLCVGCLTAGWLASQSDTGGQLLARLGIAGTVTLLDDADIIASLTPPPTNTLQPTPTLPPTSTATPTETSIPTDTPIPSDTPVPPPADTPIPAETPTDTPVPDTPTPAVPQDTPTPETTPTPAMKYPAPTLLAPDNGTHFIVGNIIVLRWQPVGELAPDEQYAVRLVYLFETQTVYQGTNLRETQWEVPPSLFGQVDGPDNLYEWFVVVERLNDDGSGTAISPESEHRNFTWK